jgi:hypothetical protein
VYIEEEEYDDDDRHHQEGIKYHNLLSNAEDSILLRLYELFSGFQTERYSSKRCALNARQVFSMQISL